MTFYGILRTTWEHERQKYSLVKLETDFYDKVRAYTNHLETQANNEPDEIIASLFKKRWNRVLYLRYDLINLRTEKHVRNILNSINQDIYYPTEEEKFRKNLKQIIEDFSTDILENPDSSGSSNRLYADELSIAWKSERDNEELQSLDPEFYNRAVLYQNYLLGYIEKQSDELIKELLVKKNLRGNYIIRDLVSLRIKKHIRDNLSIIKDSQNRYEKPSTLPAREEQFSKELERTITKFQNDILKVEDAEIVDDDVSMEGSPNYLLVKFVKNEHITSVGVDLMNYGPFEKGDLAFIPKENARIFVKKIKVELVNLDK